MTLGIIEVTALIILSLNFLILLLLILFLKRDEPAVDSLTEYPDISILVAIRDESEDLGKCIKCLQNIDYPRQKVEILLGDDGSTDGSSEIIEQAVLEDDRITGYPIIPEQLGLKAKANVLNQLAEKANGEYLLFLDADTEVNPNWAKEMISAFDAKTGMVNGVTRVRRLGLLSRLQDLEWLFSIGMLKVITDLKGAVTGIGNNMAISREAYWDVGGFAGIPFSLTEDHEIFQAIHKKGYGVKQKFNANVLSVTGAEKSFRQLLIQRKRWMKGAAKLDFWLQSLLVIQALKGATILGLLIVNWQLALSSIFIFWLVESYLLDKILKQIKSSSQLLLLLLYPFYLSFLTFLFLLSHLSPTKTEWKGRKY